VSDFLLVFIPLFVAIDPLGLVPIFLSVTASMDEAQRRRTSFEAVGAALVICLGFMFLGDVTFKFLGIADYDFRIAGGTLLLVLAVVDLLRRGKPAVDESDTVGVVPLAMPLIAGPATLTSLLVLAARYGYALTALGLVVTFAILLAALVYANAIARLLGRHALVALSKLVMILLAAIAVNYIRVGVSEAIRATR
jgi:multiple antibiotic resistance protein